MDELAALGYRLVVDPVTPLLAMHRVLRQSYAALARGEADPLLGADAKAEQNALHEIIGLDRMLEIERRTVER
jgi:methylisocitrate lyase